MTVDPNADGVRAPGPILPIASLQVRSSGAELAVRQWSNRGEAIVLLHGGPGMPDYLAPVAALLKDRFTVFSYDQRGAGQSRCLDKAFRPADHVADLLAIADQLHLASFHLFGHSWGGLLAQLFANRHSQRLKSLFLCNAMTGVGRDYPPLEKALRRYHLRTGGPAGWLRMGAGLLLVRFPGAVGNWGAQLLYRQVWRNYAGPGCATEWLNRVKRRAVRDSLLALAQTDAAWLDPPRFEAELPVLILYSSGDPFAGEYRKVLRRYPWARQEFLPGCGHIPWQQRPAAFAGLLADFYRSCRLPAAPRLPA